MQNFSDPLYGPLWDSSKFLIKNSTVWQTNRTVLLKCCLIIGFSFGVIGEANDHWLLICVIGEANDQATYLGTIGEADDQAMIRTSITSPLRRGRAHHGGKVDSHIKRRRRDEVDRDF